MSKQSQHNSDGFAIKDLQDHLFTLMHVKGVRTNAPVLLEVKPGEQAPNFHTESIRLQTLRDVSGKLDKYIDGHGEPSVREALRDFQDEIRSQADVLGQQIETWTRFMGGSAYCPLVTITVLDGPSSPATDGDPVLLLGVSE